VQIGRVEPGSGGQPATVYDRVGGEQWFVDLVDRFYAGVAADPVLRPMYPDDLTGPKRHLTLFLIQFWGGPTTYSDERGHPQLRMRHFPFTVDQAARDAWLTHMTAAVKAGGLSSMDELQVLSYFDRASTHMMNV
jgi:hemoglobin